MLERALSLRRKLLRVLKINNLFGRSRHSLTKEPDAGASSARSFKSDKEKEEDPPVPVDGAEPPSPALIRYTSVRKVEADAPIRLIPEPEIHDIHAVPLRQLAGKTPLAIVIPPKTPGRASAPSPLKTTAPGQERERERGSDCPTLSQEFASEVERFQHLQQQRRAITRARSMPLSVGDPMRKLRDSYVRIMHKMADAEANGNQLSPGSAAFVVNENSRVFEFRKRSPADEEEEEFLNLVVMKTKFNRSVSTL